MISRVYPLCTRHLKKNLTNTLKIRWDTLKKIEINKLINDIFGSNGLECKDIDTFEKRLENITSDERVNIKTLFRKQILPLFTKHVLDPIKKKKLPINWTNNNTESANHILKSAVKWRAQDLPTFIT